MRHVRVCCRRLDILGESTAANNPVSVGLTPVLRGPIVRRKALDGARCLMFTRQCLIGLCTVAMCCLLSLHVDLRAQRDSTSKTRIVLLGTGTPSPDPERSGPATVIVVNGTPYLIDFGPGVVRRIAAASQKGVPGLSVLNIKHVFLTHLHSDHTAGYPDLILTPWSAGRTLWRYIALQDLRR